MEFLNNISIPETEGKTSLRDFSEVDLDNILNRVIKDFEDTQKITVREELRYYAEIEQLHQAPLCSARWNL